METAALAKTGSLKRLLRAAHAGKEEVVQERTFRRDFDYAQRPRMSLFMFPNQVNMYAFPLFFCFVFRFLFVPFGVEM